MSVASSEWGMLMNTMPITEFRMENKVNPKSSVFLCDLTHVKDDVLSSNVFPLGAGLIGSFLLASDIGNPSPKNVRAITG